MQKERIPERILPDPGTIHLYRCFSDPTLLAESNLISIFFLFFFFNTFL